MGFLFHEKRSFSSGDVMDLGLIAGVISENLTGCHASRSEAGGRTRVHACDRTRYKRKAAARTLVEVQKADPFQSR